MIVNVNPLILLNSNDFFCLFLKISSELIRLKDGRVTYEYDNSSKPLGSGAYSTVYSGKYYYLIFIS